MIVRGCITIAWEQKTVSESNARGHWAMRARRAQAQRQAAYVSVINKLNRGDFDRSKVIPADIKLVRVAPRKLDDDNLRGALKAIRDGVCDALLGIKADDSDPRVTWNYAQESGATRYYGVRVEIRPREAPCMTCGGSGKKADRS